MGKLLDFGSSRALLGALLTVLWEHAFNLHIRYLSSRLETEMPMCVKPWKQFLLAGNVPLKATFCCSPGFATGPYTAQKCQTVTLAPDNSQSLHE